MRTTLTLIALAVVTAASAQKAPKESKLKFQGGLWSGTNGRTSIVGVPAAKLSATFAINAKAKLEAGAMLIPGLIIDSSGARLGLSAGGTVTLRTDGWKLKPLIGAVFVKTDTWQLMPGIGFVF